MKGLESTKEFFFNTVLPRLKEEFPNDWDKIEIGKLGRGSECYGYDDELSRDHDFSNDFQLYLTPEQDKAIGFRLMRFYHSLSIEQGLQNNYRDKRYGVFTVNELLASILGSSDSLTRDDDWFNISEETRAEFLNGEIFQIGEGEITKRRAELATLPIDVKKKRLAAHLILSSQAGEYNYERILKHKEQEAAVLCLNRFIEHALEVVFLINDKPMPYYKWAFRAGRELEKGQAIVAALSSLLISRGDTDTSSLLESTIKAILTLLKSEGLIESDTSSLESAAFELQHSIENRSIRKMHIMQY